MLRGYFDYKCVEMRVKLKLLKPDAQCASYFYIIDLNLKNSGRVVAK